MMEILWDVKNRTQQFNDFTFILPSVSAGNVGQLAIDLLITSLNTEKIAIVNHDAFLPLVGADPYNSKSTATTTTSDLHVCLDHKLVILQIRSPIIKNKQATLLKDIMEMIKDFKIKDVVLLGSCHAYQRCDDQMYGVQLRYITSNLSDDDLLSLKNVGPVELEVREDVFGQQKRMLLGSGFIEEFINACDTPVASLLIFINEGDNRNDAVVLVQYLNAWKKLSVDKSTDWKIPFSWRNLFGGPVPLNIY